MGFFKKFLGTAAIVGAAVGSASYIKKRKEEKDAEEDIFEDFDDEKVFDFNTDSDGKGNKKVTITFNSRKAKAMADNAADAVIDGAEKAKSKVVDIVGEEKFDSASKKVNEATSYAKDKVNEAKDVIVEKVGEENIDAAKDRVNKATTFAKEKVTEAINKFKGDKDSEIFDVEYEDIDDSTEDDVEDINEEDSDFDILNDTEDITVEKSAEKKEDDFLSDELDEL